MGGVCFDGGRIEISDDILRFLLVFDCGGEE